MSVLVLANTNQSKITKNAMEAVSYGSHIAKELGTDTIAVVAGNCDDAGSLGVNGASKVIQVSGSSFEQFDPAAIVKALSEIAQSENSDVIVLSHDYSGKAVAGRLSAKLDAGLVSGAVDYPDLSDGFVVKKAVFSGKAFAGVQINTNTKIISLLPNSVEVSNAGAECSVESMSVDASSTSTYTVKEVKKESTELSLTEAELVVSAGRGLKGPENWGMIEELAKELGAATACSRPVADIGWRPHHEHVGQTGTAIRPNLYIAIGISGAIQHLAGVNGSKVIVVINTDAEAPFFKAADYGIIGDAFDVVPKLIDAVKNFKAANN